MMNSTNVPSESRRLKVAHTFQSVIDVEEEEIMPTANRRMEHSFDPNEVDPNIEYQIMFEGIPLQSEEPPAPVP
jgi:hypothetical protein